MRAEAQANESRNFLPPTDRIVLISMLILISFVFLVLAFLPLISFYLPVTDAVRIDKVKTILQQYGNYGDSFGVGNALFSGFALMGVVYAVLLQKREIGLLKEQMASSEGERRDEKHFQKHNAFLLSVSSLAQIYAMQYGANPSFFDAQFKEADDSIDTVKGNLEEYTHILKSYVDHVCEENAMEYAESIRTNESS